MKVCYQEKNQYHSETTSSLASGRGCLCTHSRRDGHSGNARNLQCLSLLQYTSVQSPPCPHSWSNNFLFIARLQEFTTAVRARRRRRKICLRLAIDGLGGSNSGLDNNIWSRDPVLGSSATAAFDLDPAFSFLEDVPIGRGEGGMESSVQMFEIPPILPRCLYLGD